MLECGPEGYSIKLDKAWLILISLALSESSYELYESFFETGAISTLQFVKFSCRAISTTNNMKDVLLLQENIFSPLRHKILINNIIFYLDLVAIFVPPRHRQYVHYLSDGTLNKFKKSNVLLLVKCPF